MDLWIFFTTVRQGQYSLICVCPYEDKTQKKKPERKRNQKQSQTVTERPGIRWMVFKTGK